MPRTMPRRSLVMGTLMVWVLSSLTSVAASSVEGAGPTAGGFTSDNVEYIAHVPLNYDSPGARIVGKYLYLTTSRRPQDLRHIRTR